MTFKFRHLGASTNGPPTGVVHDGFFILSWRYSAFVRACERASVRVGDLARVHTGVHAYMHARTHARTHACTYVALAKEKKSQ